MPTKQPLTEGIQPPQERAELLDAETFPILAGVSPVFLDILNKAARVMHISPDAEVIREDEIAQSLYFIRSGRLEIAKRVRGQPRHITHLLAGDLYGEFGVIRSRPRYASVISVEHCQVIRVDKEAALQVMQVDDAFKERIEILLKKRLLDSFFFSHPVFNQLSPEDSNIVGKKLRILSLEPGEQICSQDALAKGVYFILSGKAEIFHIAPSGDEVRFVIQRTNDMVGEITHHSDAALNYSSTAASDLDLALIDDDAMHFISGHYPEMYKLLEKDIRQRATDTIKRIQENLA